jgi:hypothetical protein
VFACKNIGIKEDADKVWLVSFMQYDLGFFDHETGRITSAEKPLWPKKCYPCARNEMATMWSEWTVDVGMGRDGIEPSTSGLKVQIMRRSTPPATS